MAVIPRYDAQVSTNPLANKRQTAMMTPGAMAQASATPRNAWRKASPTWPRSWTIVSS